MDFLNGSLHHHDQQRPGEGGWIHASTGLANNPGESSLTEQDYANLEARWISREFAIRGRADADHGPSAGPPCSVCGGPMRLYESAGIWLCNDSPTCSGVRSVGSVETEAEAAAMETRSGAIELNCPICDSPMVVTGILRRQLTCLTSGCGFQLEPRLSAGILRILSRRRQPV